jgi:CRISPR-associated protein Cas2
MISYDIEDNRVRRRVHDLLKDHGARVQFSVFECWLDSRQVAGLRIRVQREIQDRDSVRWYPLCAWCKRSIDWHGQGSRAEDADFHLL